MPFSLRIVKDTVTPALAALAGGKLHDLIADEFDVSGQNMEDTADVLVPVRSGYLQSTIGHEVDREQLIITLFAGANYAGFVELGTRRMAAQPYLRPAYDGELPMLQDGIAAAVLNAWARSS